MVKKWLKSTKCWNILSKNETPNGGFCDFVTKMKIHMNAVCIGSVTQIEKLMMAPYKGTFAYTGSKLQTKKRMAKTTPSPPSSSIWRLFFILSPMSPRCFGFHRKVTEGGNTLFLSFGRGRCGKAGQFFIITGKKRGVKCLLRVCYVRIKQIRGGGVTEPIHMRTIFFWWSPPSLSKIA